MKTSQSRYQGWLLQTFGGKTPLLSLYKRLDGLRVLAKQNALPVVLGEIAKLLKINPTPLYEPQTTEARLIVLDGQVRISLRSPSGRAPSPGSSQIAHKRFLYAHELVHALALDLSGVPPVRCAPTPRGREEEYFCDCGARRLIVPPSLLQKELKTIDTDIASWIERLSKKAQASIYVLGVQLFDTGMAPSGRGTMCILSAIRKGLRRQSSPKPRAIRAVALFQDGRKIDVLSPLDELDFVISPSSESWSLADFHAEIASGSKRSFKRVEGETVIIPGGQRLVITGEHTRIGNTPFVWTEVQAEPL